MKELNLPWRVVRHPDGDVEIRDAKDECIAVDTNYYPWWESDFAELICESVNKRETP